MNRSLTQALMKNLEDSNEWEEDGEIKRSEACELNHRVSCISLHSHKKRNHLPKQGKLDSVEPYGLWRQEQKIKAARLEKQLRTRWALDDLIEEQLKHFHDHFNRGMVPTRLKDVAQLLMPKWTPPLEMASVGWFGDWRPTSILELLRSLCRSYYISPSLMDSVEMDRTLLQLIKEIRVEETVLDEEMAEIQANCILHLPFGPVNQGGGSGLSCVQSELGKIRHVILRAQQLRFKAVEVVVKKVLSQIDAAEFLVAFAGLQDAIHHYAVQQKIQNGPVSVPSKFLGII